MTTIEGISVKDIPGLSWDFIRNFFAFSWYIPYKLRPPYTPLFTKINHTFAWCTSTSHLPKYTLSYSSLASLQTLLSPSDTFLRTITTGARFRIVEKDNLRDVEINEVNKILSCKDERRGFFTYLCERCGTMLRVHFGCNSRICSNCGKNHTDKWAKSLQNALWGVPHRHAVLTIPSALWPVVKNNRFPEGLDGCCDCSNQQYDPDTEAGD